MNYWRVGYAPYVTIPGPVFEDRGQCAERARQEKKYGGYRGYALKPYKCDENGNLVIDEPEAKKHARRLDRPVGVIWLAPGRAHRDAIFRPAGYWQIEDSASYFSVNGMAENAHAIAHPDQSVERGKQWDESLAEPATRPRRR